MRTLPLAIIGLLASISLGCRTNSGQYLLEQESRMWESEVYNLEAELNASCEAREALAQENEELKRKLGDAGSYRAPARELPSSSSSGSSTRKGPLTEAPLLEAPSIELPEPSSTPPDSLPGAEPSLPGPGDGSGIRRQPVELVINKQMTGGLDRDRAGGDEGLLVLVEPRDEQGRLVQTPGSVSIVLMDPSKTGEASRVARWDFPAHEFADHFRKTSFGQGLEYELKWPGQQPASRDLMLFVRYTSPAGTRLTSDTPLAIRLAGDYPREARSQVATAAGRESDDITSRAATTSASEPREIASAAASEPPPRRQTRAIPPRQARNDRPEWKPYR